MNVIENFCGKENGYSKSGGLHGVGTSCVVALSDYFDATVYRDGNIYNQKYSRGKKTTEVTIIGQTENAKISIPLEINLKQYTGEVISNET